MRFVLVLAVSLVLTAVALAGNPPDPVETHVIATGSAPCGTTVARGAVWVGVYGTGKLLRLDPDTGRVTRRIPIGSSACRVAVDRRAAWVTRDRAGELVRVDLDTGRLRRLDVGASPFDVILAFGAIWVTSFEDGTVTRIDPVTRRVTQVYEVGPNPAGITGCGGRIWVGHGREATRVTSIDPATHRLRRLDVGTKTPGWPSCVFGELWVTTPRGVLRVDARSGKVRARVRLGGTPAEAATGPDGLVWVTDKERSLVHRIYAEDAAVVDSFAAGPGAYSLARVDGGMWITSFAGADIRRYERR